MNKPFRFKKSMIILGDGESASSHMCFGGSCVFSPYEKIPQFYSKKHAEDSGWRFTDDLKLLPNPGWICPDCLKPSTQNNKGGES